MCCVEELRRLQTHKDMPGHPFSSRASLRSASSAFPTAEERAWMPLGHGNDLHEEGTAGPGIGRHSQLDNDICCSEHWARTVDRHCCVPIVER